MKLKKSRFWGYVERQAATTREIQKQEAAREERGEKVFSNISANDEMFVRLDDWHQRRQKGKHKAEKENQ